MPSTHSQVPPGSNHRNVCMSQTPMCVCSNVHGYVYVCVQIRMMLTVHDGIDFVNVDWICRTRWPMARVFPPSRRLILSSTGPPLTSVAREQNKPMWNRAWLPCDGCSIVSDCRFGGGVWSMQTVCRYCYHFSSFRNVNSVWHRACAEGRCTYWNIGCDVGADVESKLGGVVVGFGMVGGVYRSFDLFGTL